MAFDDCIMKPCVETLRISKALLFNDEEEKKNHKMLVGFDLVSPILTSFGVLIIITGTLSTRPQLKIYKYYTFILSK